MKKIFSNNLRIYMLRFFRLQSFGRIFFRKFLSELPLRVPKNILAVVSAYDIANLKLSELIFREDLIDSMQISLISNKIAHR